MTDEQKQLVLDYQITFDTDSGRRVKADLENKCRFNQVFDCDDAMILSQVTGERNVFVYIKQQVETDLDEKRQETAESEAEDENM